MNRTLAFSHYFVNQKNKPERLIVVFDDDELLASRAATILVERGYENVYMLSGGLNLAKKRFKAGGFVVKTTSYSVDAGSTDGAKSDDGFVVFDGYPREFGSLHRPGALDRLRRDTAGLTLGQYELFLSYFLFK